MTCVKIGKAGPEHIDLVWSAVGKHIACFGKEWLDKHEDLDNINDRIRNGSLDLWLMAEASGTKDLLAVGICEWSKTPKRNIYYINWCGGDKVGEFLHAGLEMCERYACLAGAHEIRLEGRKGWQRALLKYGYTPVVQMKKEVKVLWSK